jgi:putative ABC transport system permease protein
MLRVTLKGLVAHKLRFALTGLAVLLGVSFMAGTMTLTDTVQKVFDDLFADIYENTDAVVRGPEAFESEFATTRPPIPEAVLDDVLAVDGVEYAEGGVQIDQAQLTDRDGEPIGNPGFGAPAFGFAWTDSPLNPFVIVEGRAPLTAGEVVIDRGSADKGDLTVGSTTTVITGLAPKEFEVVGIATFGTADSPAGASVALFTMEEAQRLGAQVGQFDDIGVIAADGVTQDEIRDRLAEALAGRDDVEVVTGAEVTEENQDAVERNLGFFRTALLAFAVIALGVGVFIIYNTFSIVVAQRTRELALLRAVGASRRQVLAAVLGESIAVGVLASVAGILAGIGLSVLLKALLNSAGFDIPGGGVVVQSSTVVTGLVVGAAITLASAVLPARRASRIAPLAALRDVAVERPTSFPVRTAIGSVLVAGGVALLAVGLFADVSNAIAYVGGGAALVFVGVFVLGPLLARPVVRALGTKPVGALVVGLGGLLGLAAVVTLAVSIVDLAPAGVVGAVVLGWIAYVVARSGLGAYGMTGRLARENAIRNPRRTATTAAALMIGVALVGFITVFLSSVQESVRVAVDEQVPVDFIVTTKGQNFGGAGFSPELATRLRELPELAAVGGVRGNVAQVVDPSHPKSGSVEFVTASDPETADVLFDFGVEEGSLAALTPDGVAVSRDVADDDGLALGDTIVMRFAQTGEQQLTVQAIFADDEVAGNYLLSLDGYERNFGEQLDVQVFIKLADGVSADDARAAIEPVLADYPNTELKSQAEFKEDFTAAINQVLNLIYALLGLAVLIALIGIANTLTLSIHERTRELGLLRAVGMSKVQTRLSIRWESVIISLFGTALGLAIGLFFGWAVVRSLRDEGFSEFSVAPAQLVALVFAAVIAGVLASVAPARRAARLDVLDAIAFE